MKQTQRSLIESLGVYLPPRTVSTKTIVDGCVACPKLPLERLTGIASRHMAGETEFSLDLGVKAVADCLARSQYGPDDIDLVVCCNISRLDGANEYSFEPSTASRICATFGIGDAIAFDLTNACAGMFTGIYLVNALISSGAIRRGLVVSGEYITHLTRTAQLEIESLGDPRVACLTLGDAGAAVIIDGTERTDCGFYAVDLFTLGRHSDLCIAKTTDQPHGGAIMTTDMLALAKIAVTAFLQHSAATVFRLRWRPDQVDHIVPHQTSRTTLETASREVKRLVAGRAKFEDKIINNVANRANTATTSHFVALKDAIVAGKVRSGESIVFGIQASGVTVGTAVYRLDDLPDRLLETPADSPQATAGPKAGCFARKGGAPRVRIEAVGVLPADTAAPKETMAMLTAASERCLDASGHPRNNVNLLLSTGVYRTDFLCEPALATLLAGALKINDSPKNPLQKRSLAFDLVNSGLGFLQACFVVSELIRSGAIRVALIAASEVENNPADAPEGPRGVCETASAVILDSTRGGETGFGAFRFATHPQPLDSFHAFGANVPIDGCQVPRINVRRDPEFDDQALACTVATVRELLSAEGVSPGDLKVVLPPQGSPSFIDGLARELDVPRDSFVDVSREEGDLFTSSMAYGFDALSHEERVAPGDLGLIIGVAAGIEVGCALYHF